MRRKGLGKGRGKGYKNIVSTDARVHSDSRKGIKQPQKARVITRKKKLPDVAEFYDYLWKENDGVFYRGVSNGREEGYGELGKGIYFAWDEGVATTFGQISAYRRNETPKLITAKLPRDLKLLDSDSATMKKIKAELGLKSYEKIVDYPILSMNVTRKVQERGYDGVISDNKYDGLIIYDKDKVEVISTKKTKKVDMSPYIEAAESF